MNCCDRIETDSDMLWGIQGVPGGKDNIVGGHSIGHSKQKIYIEVMKMK
jgi:hypothetical protein